jgi:hypothetical protein
MAVASLRIAPVARAARAPRAAPAAAAPRRGPHPARAVELDSDTITIVVAAVAGVGFGIGLPVLFSQAERRDKERIEEIRELNRATLKATGETLSEVRPLRLRLRNARGVPRCCCYPARRQTSHTVGACVWRTRAVRLRACGAAAGAPPWLRDAPCDVAHTTTTRRVGAPLVRRMTLCRCGRTATWTAGACVCGCACVRCPACAGRRSWFASRVALSAQCAHAWPSLLPDAATRPCAPSPRALPQRVCGRRLDHKRVGRAARRLRKGLASPPPFAIAKRAAGPAELLRQPETHARQLLHSRCKI